MIRISDFTAVELFDALANSQGDPIDYLSYDYRHVEKLCELNCLTLDLDVGNVGAQLVSSGTQWVQFKSRILNLTWSLFKQKTTVIDKQRKAAEAQRKAAEAAAEEHRKTAEAAEADRKAIAEAQRKTAEAAEADRKAIAEAQRKTAEEQHKAAEEQHKAAEEHRKATEEHRKTAEAAEADRKAKDKIIIDAEAQRLKNALLEEAILSDKARAAKLELAALEEKFGKRNAAKSQSPKRNTKGFNKSKK